MQGLSCLEVGAVGGGMQGVGLPARARPCARGCWRGLRAGRPTPPPRRTAARAAPPAHAQERERQGSGAVSASRAHWERRSVR
eukprot:6248530-Prymnesium_polylepis.1